MCNHLKMRIVDFHWLRESLLYQHITFPFYGECHVHLLVSKNQIVHEHNITRQTTTWHLKDATSSITFGKGQVVGIQMFTICVLTTRHH